MKRFILWLPLLLVVLAGLLGTADLLHVGFPLTHDGDVHLLRLTNFYQSLSEGIWIPRWAANVNWGYGQPVFEFFYPLPSYIASVLHFFGVSFADSLKLLLGLSLILSGLTMFLWLNQLCSRWSAFFGAFLYMFAPFRFVDLYVRGDIGESFALIFVPLILYFMTLAVKSKNKYPVLLGSISLALLILCHNIVSLMAMPFILFYAFYEWFGNGKTKMRGMRLVSIVVIGFLLAAFFWIPGLFEGKYTLRNIVTKGEYAKRFVDLIALFYGPWNYGGSGTFTVQLGIVQWIVVIFSLIAVFLRKTKQVFLLGALLLYTLLAIFLMLPLSHGIWDKILLLQNFQFPWRFLLITLFSTSVMGAILIDALPKKIGISAVLVLVATSLVFENSYWHAKAYISRPDTTFAGIFKGPSDTGESSPIWGIRFMENGFNTPLEILDGKATIAVKKRTSTDHEYVIVSDQQATLMENTLYFPGWRILIDGREVPIEFQNQQHRGLMLFSIPAGKHTIQAVFMDTKLRKAADYLSLVTAIALSFLLLPLPKRFKILS